MPRIFLVRVFAVASFQVSISFGIDRVLDSEEVCQLSKSELQLLEVRTEVD